MANRSHFSAWVLLVSLSVDAILPVKFFCSLVLVLLLELERESF